MLKANNNHPSNNNDIHNNNYNNNNELNVDHYHHRVAFNNNNEAAVVDGSHNDQVNFGLVSLLRKMKKPENDYQFERNEPLFRLARQTGDASETTFSLVR